MKGLKLVRHGVKWVISLKMHVFMLAETFGEDHGQFVTWLKSLRMKRSDEEKRKLIKGGMGDPNPDLIDDARPIVREVRLYDVVVPEDNRDEFLSVVKGFQTQRVENVDTLRGKVPVESRDIEVTGNKYLKRVARYFAKFIPGLDQVDMSEYDAHPHVKWHKWVYCYVVGVRRDEYNQDDIEMT